MRNFGPKSSVISGKESAMTDPYEGFSGEIDEQLVDCEVDPDDKDRESLRLFAESKALMTCFDLTIFFYFG